MAPTWGKFNRFQERKFVKIKLENWSWKLPQWLKVPVKALINKQQKNACGWQLFWKLWQVTFPKMSCCMYVVATQAIGWQWGPGSWMHSLYIHDKNLLKRREESDTYLTHVCRHCRSRQITIKMDETGAFVSCRGRLQLMKATVLAESSSFIVICLL